MRAYRKQVLESLRPLVRPESMDALQAGLIMFNTVSFNEHFVDDWHTNIHLADTRKTKIKTIRELLELLFGLDDIEYMTRKNWEGATFRFLCLRACELIQEHCGVAARVSFHDLIGRYFIATHWLIPLPLLSKFIQRGKERLPKIKFVAILHLRYALSNRHRGQTYPVTDFLPTTVNTPSIYRPLPHQLRGPPKLRYETSEEEDINDESIPLRMRIQRQETRRIERLQEQAQLRETEARKPRWTMIDWDLQELDERGMELNVSDFQRNNMPIDGILEDLSYKLDQEWQAWEQEEAMVQLSS